ncbi:MAG: SAM-dependent chlorinase/fluorinase [Bacteroidota bacterium]
MKNVFRRIFPGRPSFAPLALITDFGSTDPYVGTMKGVIASIHPDAKVIDICHSAGPQNVREASYLLWSCYRFFPRETVFIVVVDPGVGTNRRILLLRTASRWFLAPDNGVLDFVLGDGTAESATSIRMTDTPYILSPVSQTFHARDVFAPVGAFLSLGVSPGQLGEPIDPPIVQSSFVTGKPQRLASILHIDHFGNIITDIRPAGGSRPNGISIKGKIIRRWTSNYREAKPGSPSLIMGSSGLVEIVLKDGHAAKRLHARPGERLKVLWS